MYVNACQGEMKKRKWPQVYQKANIGKNHGTHFANTMFPNMGIKLKISKSWSAWSRTFRNMYDYKSYSMSILYNLFFLFKVMKVEQTF